MEATDVVVAGGGIIGLSAAWEAAQHGLTVRVVDPAPGRGAAWAAAGMLAPVTETTFGEESLTRLFLAAANRWPDFSSRLHAATGWDTGFRACGTIAVALDASDRAEIDQILDFQHGLGLEAERLSATDCRSLIPVLSPAVRGGALMPGDHQVDNRALVLSLIDGCVRAGVKLASDRVVSISLDQKGEATGVVTESGQNFLGGTVVLAAGVGMPGIEGLPEGVVPPVRPVKGHVARLRAEPDHEAFSHTIRGLVHGRRCYLVARADGSVVVGATSEEQGYDTTVRAGALHSLLDDARLLVPLVDEWEFVECIAGLRPASPDNAPYVGPTSVPRLLIAAGHYRNGFLLAPLTAEAIVSYLTTGKIPPPLDAFPADRHFPAARTGEGR
ncbi:MAG TPA: glycine oxidase ThiO [Acidimicrobiales bacterium]|nr:glycine oxidase ThiO [Acidimicrobiales bacterium]